MLDSNLLKALMGVSSILNQERLDWLLIGSASLALQNVEISPHDLDISLDKKDLSKIAELFSDYIEKPLYEDTHITDRSVLKIAIQMDGVEIEFMGEGPETGLYLKKHSNAVIKHIENVDIPLLSLNDSIELYERTDRLDKAELIKSSLSAA